ncbi:predicted protein [Sclerotinia sclerotiorum 1980 UF-70]|uniref:Uncharacterized protein n=1 Tax=Sclerotinia sclerotiorum (strain ATCC 18683 / 1980 / Ss-1) TaxID=665079 RepID=A7ESA8_SCLS1|nr:predicted protein [Sclerotinia sclerotiorum 1980 UF-70]EDN92350.1 predicted protein [Sclerotinia sclerotiorum 1980 UF-70]
MDGLSGASAVFAVVSLAVQLAETIHKLVEFWKAVEDAPDNITRIFQELGLLSKILTQSHELAQCHSFSDIFDEALEDLQNNSLLARPFSTSNVYQFNQKTSRANTQIFQSMQITERELAKGLAEKQNLLSSGYLNENLVPFHPVTKRQRFIEQGHDTQGNQLSPEYADIPQSVGVSSRERHVYGKRGCQITGPFSNIWTVSQEVRERAVHASGAKENVQAESQLILYPSKWLAKIGMAYGVKFSVLASRGWQYSLQPFRAVPENALIFEFCREGNLEGIRTLLSRGDASPYDKDPLGRTPLWYAVLHHQLDISALLLSEGADVQEMDWVDRRPNRIMDLDVASRNESVLVVLQYLAPYFHRTNYNFNGLFSDLLSMGYDGAVLQWSLSNIPGKLRGNENRSIIQRAIRRLLLIQEPLTMKTIIDKSMTADLHLYIDPSPSQVYGRETPTSLAMYDLEGFLVWRRLLKELGFDISDFVAREIEAGVWKSNGWTQQTLLALFEQELTLPKLPKPFNPMGCRPCDRCQQPTHITDLNKVDLEWRRKLRAIRTGKAHDILDDCSALVGKVGVRYDITDRTNGNGVESALDPLPYRIVCPRKCEDGICVAWEFENFEPPSLPPYIPKEERKRLERLRLLEEEAKCPTYTMPGAFRIQ